MLLLYLAGWSTVRLGNREVWFGGAEPATEPGVEKNMALEGKEGQARTALTVSLTHWPHRSRLPQGFSYEEAHGLDPAQNLG